MNQLILFTDDGWTSFNIAADPIPAARPRVTRHGTYDSQAVEKKRYRLMLHEVFPLAASGGPIEVRFIFYLKRPKNHYGTGRNSFLLKSSAPKYHVNVPDLDNLEKFIMDCMSGIAWVDDRQVVINNSKKYWWSSGATAVKFRRLE